MKSKGKTKIAGTTTMAILIAGMGIVWNTGCVSRGYQKSDIAADTLHSAAGEIQAEARALDVTLASLNDLVNKPSGDLRLQFEGYSSNLDQFIATARRNDKMLQLVGEKNGAYFANWDKEIATMNYEAVRARSQERKNEVTADFDSVYRRYQETQATVGPVIVYFQDIRKALSTDLTGGGLEAMKATISNVNDNAAKVQTALSKLADDLAAFGTRISSAVVQNRQP